MKLAPEGELPATLTPERRVPAVEKTHPRRHDLRIALLLALICLFVYNVNLRLISSGDALPARFLPFGIWRYHTLVLDPILDAATQGYPKPYWISEGKNGRMISFYPVVLPVLIAPLYLPAIGYLNLHGWTQNRLDFVSMVMEKLTASLIASAAVFLMYLLLRRRAGSRDAILLTVAFALGTNTWMIGSQALWQHGLAELLVVGALLLLTGACTAGRALVVGILFGLITMNRAPDALLVAAMGLYGLGWAKRRSWLLFAGAAVPVGLVLGYNLWATGALFGGYGLLPAGKIITLRNNTPASIAASVAGLLFSPARGLFVFSPFLILLLIGLGQVVRDKSSRRLTVLLAAAVLFQLLIYSKLDWRGGYAWGPRFLTDVLPVLVWMLVPVLGGLHRFGRSVFAVAVGVSVAIQAVGAFWYTGQSDRAIYAVSGPDEMKAAWNLRNTPFFSELRHARAPIGRPQPARCRHCEERGAGSAESRRTPAVALAALGSDIETRGRAAAEGVSLGAAAAGPQDAAGPKVIDFVASTLRSRQQAAGFWLTSHTTTPRFENSRKEMNTYLTSIMIDILDPIAGAAGLADSVARARRHLTDQIESTGLVRYHGRPDGPTIPALGCVITPDSDDTALVWRIAPSSRQDLMRRAITALKEYRNRDGLYRTWLAPSAEYRCIDPGADPNPADAGIQMHVYQLLVTADPPAARDLCGALNRSIGDDRIWVYYAVAPLVPVLRQADLRQAGCPVRIPQARLARAAAGQEDWLAAASSLDDLRSPEGPRPSSQKTEILLRRLAKDNFAAVRRAPPLLYHNDFTGTTPRFYWSEDFGYALWLRLYIENARQRKSQG